MSALEEQLAKMMTEILKSNDLILKKTQAEEALLARVKELEERVVKLEARR